MQAIKDLVCSDDPVNHQLGLILAFTEYGKSFETFMMVLDWHSFRNNKEHETWLIDFYINDELCLFIKSQKITSCFILEHDGDNLYMNCFIQGNNETSRIFKKEYNCNSVYDMENELKPIYHFLTYYDII